MTSHKGIATVKGYGVGRPTAMFGNLPEMIQSSKGLLIAVEGFSITTRQQVRDALFERILSYWVAKTDKPPKRYKMKYPSEQWIPRLQITPKENWLRSLYIKIANMESNRERIQELLLWNAIVLTDGHYHNPCVHEALYGIKHPLQILAAFDAPLLKPHLTLILDMSYEVAENRFKQEMLDQVREYANGKTDTEDNEFLLLEEQASLRRDLIDRYRGLTKGEWGEKVFNECRLVNADLPVEEIINQVFPYFVQPLLDDRFFSGEEKETESIPLEIPKQDLPN